MSEEVRSDEGTMDPVHLKFPDGTRGLFLKEVSDGTMDTDHMKFPDGTMDTERIKFPDGTIDSDHMKFPDGTIDPVLMEVLDGTKETDHMKFPDGSMETGHMKFPDGTMDPVLVEVLDGTMVMDHMKFPDSTMDTDHMKIPDGTVDPALLKFPDGTMDTDHMKFPDGTMDPDLMEVLDGTMDTDHMKFPDPVIDTDHMKFPDELDPDQVHRKVPDELWLKIKGFLNAADLTKLGATSHRYNSLSKDPTLWKKLIIDLSQINNHYQSLESVIENATQLKYITITDKMAITLDKESFVKGAPHRYNINVDQNAMVTLIEKAKATLIALTVGNDDEMGNELENGTTFKVTELGIELKNETIVKFGCLSRLETLELCGNDLSSSGVRAIAKLENLKVLKIPGVWCNIEIKKTVLNYLFRKLKNLRVVDLSFHHTTNETLSILAQNNPNLEELKLYGCRGLNIGNFDVGSFMPRLRNLTLRSTAISKKGLTNMVKNCIQLSHLDLQWCFNFKKGFLGVLKKNCPNLENLKLGYLLCDVLKKNDIRVFTTHFKKLKSLAFSENSDPTLHSCADQEFLQAMANLGIEIELCSELIEQGN